MFTRGAPLFTTDHIFILCLSVDAEVRSCTLESGCHLQTRAWTQNCCAPDRSGLNTPWWVKVHRWIVVRKVVLTHLACSTPDSVLVNQWPSVLWVLQRFRAKGLVFHLSQHAPPQALKQNLVLWENHVRVNLIQEKLPPVPKKVALWRCNHLKEVLNREETSVTWKIL